MPLPVFDSWGLLVRSDHALANNKSIFPADIQDLPLLVSHQASGNDTISGWLGRDLASYNVVGTYNLLYNASIMVEAGLGSALCPDGVVSTDEHTPLTFLPLFPPLRQGMCLTWKKREAIARSQRLPRHVSPVCVTHEVGLLKPHFDW